MRYFCCIFCCVVLIIILSECGTNARVINKNRRNDNNNEIVGNNLWEEFETTTTRMKNILGKKLNNQFRTVRHLGNVPLDSFLQKSPRHFRRIVKRAHDLIKEAQRSKRQNAINYIMEKCRFKTCSAFRPVKSQGKS